MAVQKDEDVMLVGKKQTAGFLRPGEGGIYQPADCWCLLAQVEAEPGCLSLFPTHEPLY